VERRKRQIEKLPSPVALADVQYPLEKTVLCDQHFQRPVYDNHLDTPDLFNLTPPDDFFIFWNIRDCGRTAYPPLPDIDHRFLRPGTQEWQDHRAVALSYLEKHGVVPHIVPLCPQSANLTVMFAKDATLSQDNFWTSVHCGNFIELKSCQSEPAVRIQSDDDSLYTLIIASPDYPTRVRPNSGFFVHWIATNLKASTDASTPTVLVPFVPPLPTEDAGTARVLCMLFRQNRPMKSTQIELPFSERSNFRLHDPSRRSDELRELDASLDPNPTSISFFQTAWDIQVQEWYQRADLDEPCYIPDDIERIVAVNALPKEKLQISSKTLPDGSTNPYGVLFHDQYGETVHHRRTATRLLSARTMLSRDRKPYVAPS
jgi:hypothetical protein